MTRYHPGVLTPADPLLTPLLTWVLTPLLTWVLTPADPLPSNPPVPP
jgi:hypothetical protein